MTATTPSFVVVERPHAKISPSSFERAEACTQSVRLSASAPPRLAGPDAQAGTAQHALLETCLSEDLDTFELGDNIVIQVDGHEVEIDDEMLDSVQLALDWIRANMPPPLLIEKKVKLGFAESYLGSPMFGWIDVATKNGPPWIVADAKFGFNVVNADAIQMALYLLGLALENNPDLVGTGHAGTAVVIQPNARADPVRTHEYSWEALRIIKRRVIMALTRIQRQDWTYRFGDHCRYCPAAGICPHLHAIARDPALTAISPSAELVASGEMTVQMLEQALDMAPILEQHIKKLNVVAEDYLIHGGKLRNRKLVRKRTNRRWIEPDDVKVAAALQAIGIEEPWTRKVLSPNAAEKALPKGRRAEIKDLAEQPLGELTIALKDDPKPEIEVGETLRNALKQSVAGGFLVGLPKA